MEKYELTNAWIYGNAKVCGDAKVYGNAEAGRDESRSKQVGGDHYSKYEIEPVEFITKNNLSYLQGNVIKYVVRYKDKNGIEDLEKAKHYIEMMIRELDDTM